MPAKKSFGAAALFWSFALGVTLALVVCAGVFKVINDAPVPFVTKVQTVQNEGDELRALKDPNQSLYKEGQGTEQKSAEAVATITAAGTADGPTMAPADQAAADGKIDTMRYWVQAGAFSQSADAESMRARIAFIGLDAAINYRSEGGKRLYRVRVGPFDTAAQAEEIKQSLADNAIQGTVMRLQD